MQKHSLILSSAVLFSVVALSALTGCAPVLNTLETIQKLLPPCPEGENCSSKSGSASSSGSSLLEQVASVAPRPFKIKLNIVKTSEPDWGDFTVGVSGYAPDYTIDCDSDGVPEGEHLKEAYTCRYKTPGIKEVSLQGDMPGLGFDLGAKGSVNNAQKIVEVVDWGTIQWGTMGGLLAGAINLTSVGSTTPIFSDYADISYLFQGLVKFNSPLSHWDVSKVNHMDGVFAGATSFNQDLSSWDVSNVNTMKDMFHGASSFNQDLSSWDVSKVADMNSMFQGASSFNQDLSSWNVSNVDRMNSMFEDAVKFNSPIDGWDVSGVWDMDSMFKGAISFNQSLANWNVSHVNQMDSMFEGAKKFNQDISLWDVSGVYRMNSMFKDATSFNQDLRRWNHKAGNVSQCSDFDKGDKAWKLSNRVTFEKCTK